MHPSPQSRIGSTDVGAVILAAGASSRMGCDKATIEFGGRTFLEHCLHALAGSCRHLVIVLGFHGDEIEAVVRPRLDEEAWTHRLIWTRNPAPERGQFSSLQAGLQALDPGYEAAVVAPVDHPLVQPETIAGLVADWRAGLPAQILKPAFRGRHGHPVLYAGEALQRLRTAAPDATARSVQQACAHAIRVVAVDDPGITRNLDTPDQISSWAPESG